MQLPAPAEKLITKAPVLVLTEVTPAVALYCGMFSVVPLKLAGPEVPVVVRATLPTP